MRDRHTFTPQSPEPGAWNPADKERPFTNRELAERMLDELIQNTECVFLCEWFSALKGGDLFEKYYEDISADPITNFSWLTPPVEWTVEDIDGCYTIITDLNNIGDFEDTTVSITSRLLMLNAIEAYISTIRQSLLTALIKGGSFK